MDNRVWRAVCAWLAVLALAENPTDAQAVPEGGGFPGRQFQVNTQTVDAQSGARVSRDGGDGLVVVWWDGYPRSEPGGTIRGQRFASNLSPVGSELQLATEDSAYDISVDSDGAGGFVVVWASTTSNGNDSDDSSIQAQRFSSDGAQIGPQFQVNSYTPNRQTQPVVSPDGSGGFVVFWRSIGSSSSNTNEPSILGQRYAAGSPVGTEFQVNSTLPGAHQMTPSVASLDDGGFVVVWAIDDINHHGPHGLLYDSEGVPAGDAFTIGLHTQGVNKTPVVSSDGAGGFVVAWSDGIGSDDGLVDVVARHFRPDDPSEVFQVNTYTTGIQSLPIVEKHQAGGFIITWYNGSTNGGSTNPDGSLHAQRYNSDGSELGGEIQINQLPAPVPTTADVKSTGNGDFLFAWTGRYASAGDDLSFTSIQGLATVPVIFGDGFESGDTTLWSKTLP